MPKTSDEVTMDAENERKLRDLYRALIESKHMNKSIYSTWVQFLHLE